jgi:hypothetical protein
MLCHFSHLFLWLEPFNMLSLDCCSTICFMQVLSLISSLWSLTNGCVLNVIEEVRIPCCVNCIQMQTFQFLHVPCGTSLFHLKYHFAVIIVFDFTRYHFVLNNIKGVMIPCLCTLYFNPNRIFCAQTLGIFLILFRAPFWSYHNIITQFVLWIIWLLSSFVEVYPSCYLICLQSLILNIVWFPSKICLCICACVFTYFIGICTPFWRNSHYIGLLSFSLPILAMDANGGEVSRV